MNDNIHNKHPSETKMPKITNAPAEMISPHWIVCLLYSKGGLISEKKIILDQIFQKNGAKSLPWVISN
jgi:hypothetical protein